MMINQGFYPWFYIKIKKGEKQMACSVKVLVSIEDVANRALESEKDFEAFRNDLKDPDVRRNIAAELRDSLEYDLPEDYRGAIEYVKDWLPDTALDSDEMIFGAERPDEIRKLVTDWNRGNTNLVIRIIQNMEQYAKENDLTLSEFLHSKVRSDGSFGDFYYNGTSLYVLRKALDAADGVFTYDSPSNLARFSYFDDKGREEYAYGVALPDDAVKYVKAHPERYALIEVVYD